MPLPRSVQLIEVGPRDGLQNEARRVDTATKLELIRRLVAAGLDTVEATAFVSPRHVPQMADHAELMASLPRPPGVRYPVLVPNERGMQAALAAGVTDIAVFTAASDDFTRHNIGCDIATSLARFTPVMALARAHGVQVRGYISCALGCPYAGAVPPAAVVQVALALDQLGCNSIALADTMGTGTPLAARAVVEAVASHIDLPRLGVHFHDTYGQALANLFAVLEVGISTIDCAISGLGGCPYAPGASGNVATEDVVYMLDGLGIATGVDMGALLEASRFICHALQRPPASRVARARGVVASCAHTT
jgi:hydroxymethylglutaryl-CoA lyase